MVGTSRERQELCDVVDGGAPLAYPLGLCRVALHFTISSSVAVHNDNGNENDNSNNLKDWSYRRGRG